MNEDNVKADNRYMEFRLQGQLYALPLLSVKEVIRKGEITSVPGSLPEFEGILNLRGQTLGVFHIFKKLASLAKTSTIEAHDLVMVLDGQHTSVGILVDEVTQVLHVEAKDLLPAPLKDNDPAKEIIEAVIHKENEDLVLILRLKKLMEFENYKWPTGSAA